MRDIHRDGVPLTTGHSHEAQGYDSPSAEIVGYEKSSNREIPRVTPSDKTTASSMSQSGEFSDSCAEDSTASIGHNVQGKSIVVILLQIVCLTMNSDRDCRSDRRENYEGYSIGQ